MTPTHRLQLEQSRVRQQINEYLAKEELTDEERAELDGYTKRAQQIEVELRAAIVASDTETRTREVEPDAELRERLELRERATLTGYLMAAAQGRMPHGAELELQQAAGVTGIPVELFEVRRRETRADAATTSPTTGTGVNVDPVRPMIYARSVLPRLGVAMPRVETGGYSTMTITTGLSAGAMAAGGARESTAATLTPKTTVPHRVSARLSIRIEDVATVGVGNFESSLRQNLTLAMSDELDKLGLTGNNTAPNPQGLLPQLTDPTDPTSVVDFDAFVEAMAGGIDGGPWAESMTAVMLVVNPETLRKAETTFQSATNYKGELSAASYLRANSAGFFSSRRMPATSTMIAQAVRFRRGTMGMDGVDAMRTAVCPMWGEIGIDDIYTDSASGIRHYNLHNLIGDVLIEQSDAYERVDLKLA